MMQSQTLAINLLFFEVVAKNHIEVTAATPVVHLTHEQTKTLRDFLNEHLQEDEG